MERAGGSYKISGVGGGEEELGKMGGERAE
jgi:hypothetical protein